MGTEKGKVEGTVYRIDRLYWGHTKALLFVEGGAVNNLLGPLYLYLDGQKSAPYDPRPHLENVVLASVDTAPKDMGLLEAFSAIRHEYC